MATAIELYQKAYELDYRQGDWEQAEEIYRKIIERFPHSEEKEYAEVHLERLEKLKGNPDDMPLKPVSQQSGSGAGIAAFSLVLSFLLLGAVGFSMYYLWLQDKKDKYTDMLLEGTMSEKTGNIKDAVITFKQAQTLLPRQPQAYRFLAELRLAQGHIELAEKEALKWGQVNPTDANLKEFKTRLEKAGGDKARGAK
jgi:tetratricopeptide (TPR) repeat protein